MALPVATQPSPQVIGAAFVQQYYFVLHQSPDQVHRFYKDSSILSRPDSIGAMTSVTTLQAINDKVLSMDFSNYTAEIESVDSQASYKDGVLVVVTGSLTGTDNIRRTFIQSFFLAPQEKGGFVVLNDIFRFVDLIKSSEPNEALVNTTNGDVSPSALTMEAESSFVQESQIVKSGEHETSHSVESTDNGDVVVKSVDHYRSEGSDEVAIDTEIRLVQSDDQLVSDAAPVSQEDEPKKSYASIVKVYKSNPSSVPISTPVSKQKVAIPRATSSKSDPINLEKQVSPSSKPPSKIEAPVSCDVVLENNSNDAEGHSVYIRNLPLSTTPDQVEEEFKKYGPIKVGGVQVRNHKVERFCFGFVEFESMDSMQAAIKASPINIGGRQAFVEEKRTTTRVVNGVVTNGGNNSGRGRYIPRGGYRNNDNFRVDNFRADNFRADNFRADNFRARGDYGGNQGYGGGRGEFRARGDYTGRGRGSLGRPMSSYQQRPFQNGNGRMFRPTVPNQTPISA